MRRMRIDVNQAAIHFAKRRPAVDRRNRLLEWPVVEHRAVEKRGRGRIDAGAQVVWKRLGDEFRAPGPACFPFHHDLVHFHDAGRREGARERRGRARGEGESRCIVEAEVALDVAVRVPTVGKVQYVVVVALMDERRIVNLNELVVAVIIGERDIKIERLAGGEQRGVGALRRAHGCHRVVHQAGHHAPVERWLEPARAYEQGKLPAHLHVRDRAETAGPGNRPEERLEEPLAPGPGARVGRKQDRDIGILEPEVAQCIHRQVVAHGAREHGTVDTARGCAGDDIDDRAQLDGAADLAQQIEIDLLGVVLGIVAIDAVEERCFRPPGAVRDRMQRARGAHQLEDFLGDAVHVDGERNTAEANERYAEFLLAQDLTPSVRAIRPLARIMQGESSNQKHFVPLTPSWSRYRSTPAGSRHP